MPERFSFEEAATLPHSAVLALQGLRLRRGRKVGGGDCVLIVGASGSVGPFAVQIAKARAAEVTGVASTAKLDFVRSLGADHVLDYTQVDVTSTGQTWDWILDVDAHHSIARWRGSVAPGGVYVAFGGPASWFAKTLVQGPTLSVGSGKSMGMMLWWKPFAAADVAEIKELIGAGVLNPVIDRRFKLDAVVDALRYVDDGKAMGKVIVTP